MNSFNFYCEKQQTAILEKYGAFYCFSATQYFEKRDPKVKYVHLQHGLCAPKKYAHKVVAKLLELSAVTAKNYHKKYGAEAIIKYEYFNYEIHISGSIDELYDSLIIFREQFPDEYSREKIEIIARKCFKEAVAKNLF